MNNPPLLTLLILTYRQSRFVREAVMSALSQDYENLEIVISDDASNDGTIEILRDCLRDYQGPHQVIINENDHNLGIGAHLRKALRLCHGEYILTQGGDDVSLSNRARVTAKYIQKFPSAAALGVSAIAIDEQGRELEASHAVDETKVYPQYHGGKLTTSQTPGEDVSFVMLIGAMAAYRCDVINLAEMPEASVAEDVILSWRAILLGDIVCVPERCVLHRLNNESITRKGCKSHSRKERQASRRRVEEMIYRSFDALDHEALKYPFVVPEPWLEYLRCARSRSLMRSLPFLFDPHGLSRYADALSRSGFSVCHLMRQADRYGILCKTVHLLLLLIGRKLLRKWRPS